jgi:hypothetical protein
MARIFSTQYRIKVTLLLILVLAALSITGIAAAQSSDNFDLGCWGALTGGGGTRESANFRVRDAFGQWAIGVSDSPSVRVRGGFIQNWNAPPAAITSQQLPGNTRLFMPVISNVVRVVRACAF